MKTRSSQCSGENPSLFRKHPWSGSIAGGCKARLSHMTCLSAATLAAQARMLAGCRSAFLASVGILSSPSDRPDMPLRRGTRRTRMMHCPILEDKPESSRPSAYSHRGAFSCGDLAPGLMLPGLRGGSRQRLQYVRALLLTEASPVLEY